VRNAIVFRSSVAVFFFLWQLRQYQRTDDVHWRNAYSCDSRASGNTRINKNLGIVDSAPILRSNIFPTF
jgi:hypothetical protein